MLAGSTHIVKGDYSIICAFGHLLTLKEPEDYDEKYADRKDMSLLPIYFDDWEVKVKPPDEKHKDSPPEERLKEIGRLLKQCEYAIHAGDPDEEGQLLIDEIFRWFDYKGKVYRLDTLDTTPSAMRYALAHLRDNRDCEQAGWSAYARSVSDAMVGYNLSRYFSKQNEPAFLPVGRVQTATMGLVCIRDALIEGHQKVKYYEVDAELRVDDGHGTKVAAKYIPSADDPNLTDGRILNRAYAQSKVDMLRDETLHDVKIERREAKEFPPLPFNMAKLSSYCGAKFGYKPQEVMDITQTLRDKYKAITYNRTDCQYLTTRQYEESSQTLDVVIENIRYRPKLLDKSIKSRCFNDKFTVDAGAAHTAIVPQAVHLDLGNLSKAERDVYLAICKYYLAQFLPPAVKEKTKLEVSLVDGGILAATASKVIEPGYLTIFKKDTDFAEDDVSPLSEIPVGLYEADVLSARVRECETKPPARYTQTSLLNDMTCIAKYVDNPEVKALLLEKDKDKKAENGSIGTTATRPAIITGLITHGYLTDDGKHIISTPKAREFYRILPDELKKPDMTAYWWSIQEDIRLGKSDYHILTNSVLDMIVRVIHTEYPKMDPQILASLSDGGGGSRPALGTCPRCGKPVIEGKKGFGCAGWREGCTFVIWKDSKLPMMKACKISASNVKTWLSGQWIDEVVDGRSTGKKFSSKYVHLKKLTSAQKGEFEADILLLDDPSSPYGPQFRIATAENRVVLGTCPRCGGNITEFGLGYSCSNRTQGCNFVIWKHSKLKMLSKTTITANDVKALLAGKPIKKSSLIRKDGQKYAASLVMRDDPSSPYGPSLEIAK